MKITICKPALFLFTILFSSTATTTMAQLYSSGNNNISGNRVGVGTDSPDAMLEVSNQYIPQASCTNCQSLAEDEKPALRLTTTEIANPPSSGSNQEHTWDISGMDEFSIDQVTSSTTTNYLFLSEETSSIKGEEVHVGDHFQLATPLVSGFPRHTIGLGVETSNGTTFQTTGSTSAAALQINQYGDLSIFTGVSNNSTPSANLTLDNNGRLGIGTSSPTAMLHVEGGELVVKDNNGDNKLQVKTNGDVVITEGRLVLADQNGDNQFEVKEDGHVVAREILVDMDEAIPDYVFDQDYDLMPIEELRSYISRENHLPNIPSAAEYEEMGGIELGELSRLLLEKQEELVLYILALEQRITELESVSEQPPTESK